LQLVDDSGRVSQNTVGSIFRNCCVRHDVDLGAFTSL
jgi:hypothetical protein